MMDLISGFSGYIVAGLAALAGVLFGLWRDAVARRANDRLAAERASREAVEDQLEMFRDADKIEQEVAKLRDDEARREAETWAARR